jgi:hypothetical protein
MFVLGAGEVHNLGGTLGKNTHAILGLRLNRPYEASITFSLAGAFTDDVELQLVMFDITGNAETDTLTLTIDHTNANHIIIDVGAASITVPCTWGNTHTAKMISDGVALTGILDVTPEVTGTPANTTDVSNGVILQESGNATPGIIVNTVQLTQGP